MLGGSGGGEDGDIGADEFPPASMMGRRRSRAVLYQLSGHYKPEKVKTKLKINNVSLRPLLVPSHSAEACDYNLVVVVGHISASIWMRAVKL